MHSALPAALLALSSCLAHPHDVAPAGPQRPTFSSGTATTSLGTFEVEGGAQRDDEGGIDVPLTLKFGAGARTEIFADVSPYRRVEEGGTSDSGASDVVVGARHRIHAGDGWSPASAFQLAAKIPVAGDADLLSSGETDLFGAWILTGAADELSWTAFYQLGLLGDPGDAGMVVEHGLALAGGHEIGPGDLSAFAEVALVLRPEWDEEELFSTFGVALRPHPDLVLDAFVVLGLSDDVPDAAVGIGFTRNLGRPGPHEHEGGAVP